MNVKAVKIELRELKRTVHIIDTMKATQERYIMRIEALSKMVQTPRIVAQIESLKTMLSLMELDYYIEKATSIEKKYIPAINALEQTEKAIILDSFINGLPYWKIGLSFGYAEVTVRKKADSALRKIAKAIED